MADKKSPVADQGVEDVEDAVDVQNVHDGRMKTWSINDATA